MTNQTQDESVDAAVKILIRFQDSAYAVPVAVLQQHRIPAEQRAEFAAALSGREDAEALPVEAPLFAVPEEALDAYRLSEAERAALDAQPVERTGDVAGFHMDFRTNPYPWQPYTGHHANETFGAMGRDGSGRRVYIGVFPAYRAPSGSGPYPGLR